MKRRFRSVLPAVAVAAVVVGSGSSGLGSTAAAATSGTAKSYFVVYKDGYSSSSASKAVASAGGSVVANYPAIGVVFARSKAADFATKMGKAYGVQGAVPTAAFATKLDVVQDSDDSAAPETTPGWGDNLSSLQWDMRQMQVPEAQATSVGSSSVTVGDIDTGLDYTHPDLAPNVDFSKSVSCVGGVADTAPSAWMDVNGHGTHTAGTIAAASNGIGIVGVAPNVKLAGIKAGNDLGVFFPEAVVCAFMWAATHNIQVTNNSYFADPWLFNCRNDPTQRAIWAAERRAIRYAQSKGVLVVAAEGNQADDLTHPTQDATSPDDTTPELRQIHNDCAVVPVEVPGVVGVTADGNRGFKSFYSSYGINTADVMAPGGDSILQRTAEAPNGRVLSTYPAGTPCTRRVLDAAATGAAYCYLQGTSMASPHVAGLAALIASAFPGMTGSAIAARLGATADNVACPADPSIYDFFPSVDSGAPQSCTGDAAFNSFAGQGQVNAYRALND